jgi:hypothetical protein
VNFATALVLLWNLASRNVLAPASATAALSRGAEQARRIAALAAGFWMIVAHVHVQLVRLSPLMAASSICAAGSQAVTRLTSRWVLHCE